MFRYECYMGEYAVIRFPVVQHHVAFRVLLSQFPTDLLVVEYADRKIFHTCAIELDGINYPLSHMTPGS